MIYCAGKTKTILRYRAMSGEKIISELPPSADISCNGGSSIIYSHTMTAPINKDFGKKVSGVKLIDPNNTWQPQYPYNSSYTLPCPIPTINGNGTTINSDFDNSGDPNINWYVDNNGFCSYEITLTSQIIVSLNSAIIRTINVFDCNFEVSCDDDCPPGQIKCTHKKYPGYCCVPCKQTGDRLKNMANKVGR